jgi:hypothetical protein
MRSALAVVVLGGVLTIANPEPGACETSDGASEGKSGGGELASLPPAPPPPPCTSACAEVFDGCIGVKDSYAICRSELDLGVGPFNQVCNAWCVDTDSMVSHALDWRSSVEEQPELARDVRWEEKAVLFLKQVKEYAERIRSVSIIGPVVSRAWNDSTPSYGALAELEASAADVARIPQPTPYGNKPVDRLIEILEELAVVGGALELHVLGAILRAHPSRLVGLDFQERYDYVSTTVSYFVAGQREDLAQPYFDQEVGAGGSMDRGAAPPHLQHLLQAWWFGRTPWPMCPPLAAMESVEGTAVDAILPVGLAADLRRNWERIADESRALIGERSHLGDIWPRIYSGGHWQGAPLYHSGEFNREKSVQNATWHDVRADERQENERPGCGNFPFTCSLLKGRLRSEKLGLRRATYSPTNEEEATLFLLGPNQTAPHHVGQQGRINVHLCLLNCNLASVYVNGSQTHLRYRAGELLAFDDGLHHSIVNHDPFNSRVILAIGVMQPARTEAHRYCFSKSTPYA